MPCMAHSSQGGRIVYALVSCLIGTLCVNLISTRGTRLLQSWRHPMQYPMRAKFGLSLSTRAVLFGWATLDDLLNAAQTAEASGYFDGIWVGDNLLSKPRAEALVTLSALAARTQRVRLGTICLASFPLRDPILMALQWASLDMLSHGRTVLAVCIGGGPQDGLQFNHELAVIGVP